MFQTRNVITNVIIYNKTKEAHLFIGYCYARFVHSMSHLKLNFYRELLLTNLSSTYFSINFFYQLFFYYKGLKPQQCTFGCNSWSTSTSSGFSYLAFLVLGLGSLLVLALFRDCTTHTQINNPIIVDQVFFTIYRRL